MSVHRQPTSWYMCGATATGKTAVALELAGRLGAEVLSLDSMAIYRGMDIGTAKPSRAEREVVPHHLIDLIEPSEEFSLAQYVAVAEQTVNEVTQRGKVPLFVGGTPLYLKALLRGIFSGPEADWEFRQAIEQELTEIGHEALAERLAAVDPITAAKLHPRDTRRMIRALEVYRATGQPISHLQMQFDEARPAEACRVFVLTREREQLHRRIEQRVRAMFASGLLDEASQLSKRGELSRTASQAVGYREALEHLSGELSLADAIEKTAIRTRRLAKKQGTWYRSLSECREVPVSEGDNPAEIAERILAIAE